VSRYPPGKTVLGLKGSPEGICGAVMGRLAPYNIAYLYTFMGFWEGLLRGRMLLPVFMTELYIFAKNGENLTHAES